MNSSQRYKIFAKRLVDKYKSMKTYNDNFYNSLQLIFLHEHFPLNTCMRLILVAGHSICEFPPSF